MSGSNTNKVNARRAHEEIYGPGWQPEIVDGVTRFFRFTPYSPTVAADVGVIGEITSRNYTVEPQADGKTKLIATAKQFEGIAPVVGANAKQP